MKRSYTSKQIAEFVGGKLTGDENINITFLGPPALASQDMLAIAFEEEHIKNLRTTEALCVLLPEGITCEGRTYIQVSRPKLAMGILLNLFYVPPETEDGIHPTAMISPTAKLGLNVSIGPGVVICNNAVIGSKTKLMANVYVGTAAEIGDDGLLYPNVYVGDKVKIGNKVIIHNGASIGADGFSFVTEKAGNIETARESGELGKTEDQLVIKIPSLGSVEIHDDVEIGANACIDRGTIQNTIIGRNTKIDNLVQIGHNVQIGQSCLLAAQIGVSGSAKIGNRCVLAGQVGLADHIEIGDDVILMAQCGVSKSIEARSIYIGTPAVPRKEFVRNVLNVKSITEMKEKLKILEKALLEKEKV